MLFSPLSAGIPAAALANAQSEHLFWGQWGERVWHLSVQCQPSAHHPSQPRLGLVYSCSLIWSCMQFTYGYIALYCSFLCLCLCSASISSFLTVLAWYPNTSLRTWCLVLHSLTLMTNMPACGQYSALHWFVYQWIFFSHYFQMAL